MKKIALVFAGFLTACAVPVPEHLDQSGGNGPLLIDLDSTAPITFGVESVGTVRGPDRGSGERGGITASFVGPGGPVCIMMDPENVYEGNIGDDTTVTNDDGDIDLFAGRSADYTGTPGIVMGDFIGAYIDPLGVEHPLDQNLCVQTDVFGLSGSHAGFGTVEFCVLDTVAGTPYTIAGETWKAPIDDDLLTVAIRVDLGGCPIVTETTLNGDNP